MCSIKVISSKHFRKIHQAWENNKMKINELLDNFEIYATNEEHQLLNKISEPTVLETLEEREQWLAKNLIIKSLAKTYKVEGQTVVVKNKI